MLSFLFGGNGYDKQGNYSDFKVTYDQQVAPRNTSQINKLEDSNFEDLDDFAFISDLTAD